MKMETLMPLSRKYGITERKKKELDNLSIQVLDAQLEVEKYLAIVTSLSEKLVRFQALLTTAESNRAVTLNNVNLINQLVQDALDLKDNSDVAFNEIVLATAKTKEVASKVKDVIDKLIFSAEVVNKLATIVIRGKALNPLISDELVSRIGKAGTDANNAVALTLVALQSAYVAQASNMESEEASSLEYAQSVLLYQLLSGTDQIGNPDLKDKTSFKHLLSQAYDAAKKQYDEIQNDCTRTSLQLNSAKTCLSKAEVKLKSLQSGLAAANAAAMA